VGKLAVRRMWVRGQSSTFNNPETAAQLFFVFCETMFAMQSKKFASLKRLNRRCQNHNGTIDATKDAGRNPPFFELKIKE
jgi:hypothetical protein